MAETDEVETDELEFYTPSREPTEKELRKLALVQDRHNKAFDNAYDCFEERKENYMENMRKICMKIFDEYCTPAMQNRLQQHPEFNDKLKDNPIKTLEAIEILIYNLVRVVYPLEALTDALKNFLLMRQNKGESTIEYVKRRKQLGATVLQFLGKDFLENFMKTTEWYANADENEKKNLLKQSP